MPWLDKDRRALGKGVPSRPVLAAGPLACVTTAAMSSRMHCDTCIHVDLSASSHLLLEDIIESGLHTSLEAALGSSPKAGSAAPLQ